MNYHRFIVFAVVVCLVIAVPALAEDRGDKPVLGSKVVSTPPPAPVPCQISCGDTITRVLGGAGNCAVTEDNGARKENRYSFTGDFGQVISVSMDSSDFDTVLVLYKDGQLFDFDDDGGPGFNSLLETTLTEGTFTLGAGHFSDDATGSFTLTFNCTPAPTFGPFLLDPQYPDFAYRAVIQPPTGSDIQASPELCLPDTICLSGAVPGRSELYLRILGPRPNGFLWPTIVRFTPSKVLVEIVQQSTLDVQQYILDAVAPGDEDLSGRQDRAGFQP